MKMSRSDTVTSYLTKIAQIRYEFAVGEKVEDKELVYNSLEWLL